MMRVLRSPFQFSPLLQLAAAATIGLACILLIPSAAAAQACSSCDDAGSCVASDNGGISCNFQSGPCSQSGNCTCGEEFGCIYVEDPELPDGGLTLIDVESLDDGAQQLLPEELLALDEVRFAQVDSRRYALWNCDGELTYLLEESPAGSYKLLDPIEHRASYNLATFYSDAAGPQPGV